jgi:hypothetical protein
MKIINPSRSVMLCAALGIVVCCGSSGSTGAESQSDTAAEFAGIEKDFRELPASVRQNLGPLFWLHGDESKERLEMYIGKVAEGGNGSFTAESRPHNDWLGEGWWRDLGICLEAAKKNGLQMRIFDEKWWPSQSIGGKVPPPYAAKQLTATATEVDGPRLVEAEGYAGEDYVAAVAGRLDSEGRIEGDSLVDLETSLHAGKLRWQSPVGKWRVIRFAHRTAPGLIQVGGRQLAVDGASQDCVDWFLKTVYQPHYDHFKADFGKTITGFFYDEPEVPGDWGTELNRVLAEWKVDWKKAYVAHKFQLAGEEQAAAAYQYRAALVEAWGRTLFGGMTKWCHERGVTSIGHFMEHDHLYVDKGFNAGDMVPLQKYSDMGGIDAVFKQFVMGQRVPQGACWQTPKLGSSISHAYGKRDDQAMVEIFGARGQDLTYPEMKWWTDHMLVSGVNYLIPHSFNPRSPRDNDCPPYFYDGGFEPRWPLYRVFADYTSRLSLMLSGGRHVCPVALLYLGQSALAGKHIKPEQLSESLQDALYDCDWLPFEVFEKDMVLAGKELQLRQESYKVLVVPPVEVIPYASLAKAKAFFDAGGVVVAHGFLPEKSATLGKSSTDIKNLCGSIWGDAQPTLGVCKTNAAGGRSYLLPARPTPEELQQVLAGDAGIHPTLEVIQGKTDHWLHVLHRVKTGRDLFFVINQNHLGEPRPFRFRMTASGVPECWDAMRNELTAVPFTREGGQVEVGLTLEPNESVLLVFQPETRPLLPRREPGSVVARTILSVQREATTAQVEPPSIADAKTLSPVKADVFAGHCDIPAMFTPKTSHAYLEVDDLTPEAAARVTVNGGDAGGFIGKPFRLEVTRYLKPGSNAIRIEPFAPKSARVCLE